jgi:hypothetical protein
VVGILNCTCDGLLKHVLAHCRHGRRSNLSVIPDALYLTSDVARVFHVSAETVRDWERQGRLPAKRTLGGVRLFEGRDVVRLQQIRAASTSDSARPHEDGAHGAYSKVRALEQKAGGIPVDIAPTRAALRPIYDDLVRENALAPLQGGKRTALVALDRLVNAPDSVSLSTADAALGDLKALARGASMPELRTQGQGIAARAVAQLERQVTNAAVKAGGHVYAELQTGRAATRAKYAAADVLEELHSEPVRAFRQATLAKDAGIVRLNELAKLAPSEIEMIGRAYLDDLLTKAGEEGGFSHGARLFADWQRLGTKTKGLLFKDPSLVRDLDHFFLLAKRLADNPNPSGTAFQLTRTGEAALILTNPAAGVPLTIAGAGLSKLLHSPRAVRLMTQGLRIPIGARGAAATLGAELSKLAREAGVELAPAAVEDRRTRARPALR